MDMVNAATVALVTLATPAAVPNGRRLRASSRSNGRSRSRYDRDYDEDSDEDSDEESDEESDEDSDEDLAWYHRCDELDDPSFARGRNSGYY